MRNEQHALLLSPARHAKVWAPPHARVSTLRYSQAPILLILELTFYAGCVEESDCSHCTELADAFVRLRNTLSFYRWWLWELGEALRAAPAPYMPNSTYGRWWHERRATGLRSVAAPPSRRCSLCGDVGMVRYPVPPSRWKRPEDEAARLCTSCYVAFYGPDDHWPAPEDEWSR